MGPSRSRAAASSDIAATTAESGAMPKGANTASGPATTALMLSAIMVSDGTRRRPCWNVKRLAATYRRTARRTIANMHRSPMIAMSHLRELATPQRLHSGVPAVSLAPEALHQAKPRRGQCALAGAIYVPFQEVT